MNKKKLYNVRGHQAAYWLLLILISLSCIFVLPFGIRAAFCAYDKMPLRINTQENESKENKDIEINNLESSNEGNTIEKEDHALAVGELSYLSDFLGGFIGVIVGFVLDALIIDRLRQIKKYEAFQIALEMEFRSIRLDYKSTVDYAVSCYKAIGLDDTELNLLVYYDDTEIVKYKQIASKLQIDVSNEIVNEQIYKKIYSYIEDVWKDSFYGELKAPVLKSMIETENSAEIINIPRYPVACLFHHIFVRLRKKEYQKPGEKIFKNLVDVNDEIFNANKFLGKKEKYRASFKIQEIFELIEKIFI